MISRYLSNIYRYIYVNGYLYKIHCYIDIYNRYLYRYLDRYLYGYLDRYLDRYLYVYI